MVAGVVMFATLMVMHLTRVFMNVFWWCIMPVEQLYNANTMEATTDLVSNFGSVLDTAYLDHYKCFATVGIDRTVAFWYDCLHTVLGCEYVF